ncbi:hypothetical protein E4U54_007065 [Claviceps lovelessii]|nr:hypothetical protein E4U54_007065 [Claviceps lovelessii]
MAGNCRELQATIATPEVKFNADFIFKKHVYYALCPARAKVPKKEPHCLRHVVFTGVKELVIDLELADYMLVPSARISRCFARLIFGNLRSITIRNAWTVPQHIALLNSIFEAAPALYTLGLLNVSFFNPYQEYDSHKEEDHNHFDLLCSPTNLRCLVFHSNGRGSTEYNLFKNILRVTTGLETLSISGALVVSCDVVQAALPHKDTLRVLEINDWFEGYTGSPPRYAATPAALSTFSALEKLGMDGPFFFPNRLAISGAEDGTLEEKHCGGLLGLVPVSVQKLTLRQTGLTPCIRLLAENMSLGRFPNLRHIVIDEPGRPCLEWKRNGDDNDGFLQFYREQRRMRRQAA